MAGIRSIVLRHALPALLAGAAIGPPLRAADADGAPRPESATYYEDAIYPVLMSRCGDCHHPDDPDNVVPFLKDLTADAVADRRGVWASVAEQLHNRTMPPADAEQPGEEERLAAAEWVERTLRETACRGGTAAAPATTRRLNRTEYDHTVRDLLGDGLWAEGGEPSAKFPADGGGGEGFDNNGETLFLQPILMERYLETAGDLLDAAVITPRLDVTFGPADLREDAADSDALSVEPGASVTASVRVYAGGEYAVRVTLAEPAGGGTGSALKVDGLTVARWPGERSKGKTVRETTVRLSPGMHAVTVAAEREADDAGPLSLKTIAVTQTRPEPSAARLAAHRRLFGRDPGEAPEDPRADAEAVLSRLARRAFRRPLAEGEVDRLLDLYDRAAGRGDPHVEAVKLAAKGVLVSPHFLFRPEAAPPGGNAGGDGPVPVSDHELAVRLSYFLWATTPDDELEELADAGRLSDVAVLTAQVDRMLADPRALDSWRRFVGQWLGTGEVGGRSIPDTSVFDDQYTSTLLFQMRDEPPAFFAHLLAEDRSLLELIESDYAVVSPRLEYYYGLSEPPGKLAKRHNRGGPNYLYGTLESGKAGRTDELGTFRPVPLTGEAAARRGGVLGMGAVHLATSYPTRTSPVLRGGWVLETLLGTRVPAPPPNVGQIPTNGKSATLSVRAALAKHRDNASCAACHNLLDPPGFALENFDVLGRWRERYGEGIARKNEEPSKGKEPIDATATLPSGEAFAGPAGLRKVLLERKDEFVRHLTGKLLGYALGRSLEDADDCTISRIARRVADDDYSSRTLVREVVLSDPFRMTTRRD